MAKRRNWNNQNRGSLRVKRRKKRKYTEREKRAYWIGVGRGVQSSSNLSDFTPAPAATGRMADKVHTSYYKGYQVGQNANKNEKITYL